MCEFLQNGTTNKMRIIVSHHVSVCVCVLYTGIYTRHYLIAKNINLLSNLDDFRIGTTNAIHMLSQLRIVKIGNNKCSLCVFYTVRLLFSADIVVILMVAQLTCFLVWWRIIIFIESFFIRSLSFFGLFFLCLTMQVNLILWNE